MATLGGGHGTRQIARGDLHNLIGDPDSCLELYARMIELRITTNRLGRPSTQEEQALGYQAPKSNKLLNFSLPRITVENSNRCTKCNGKGTQSAQVLLSQISPKQLMLGKKMRGRTKEEHEELQDLDPRGSPHLEEKVIGETCI